MAIKTIGYDNSGAAGDYTTIALWWAGECNGQTLAAPAIAELMNGTNLGVAGTMTAFTHTSLVTLSGCTATITNNIILRPRDGYGFGYNPGGHAPLIDPAVGPLRYDVTKGAAVQTALGYSYALALSNQWITVLGLQVAATLASGGGPEPFSIGAANITVDRCLLQTATNSAGNVVLAANSTFAMLDTQLVLTGTAGFAISGGAKILDCTIARLSTQTASGTAVTGSSTILQGTVMVGFTTATAGTFDASSDYNATDQGSIGTAGGTHNLTSLPYSTATFVAIGATPDYRIPTGSTLKDAGVIVSGITTGILGTTRPQGATPDIGAFEFPQGSALTAGTVSAGSITSTGATYSGTACTGGTATYSYQYQRCTDNGSNAPTGTLGSDVGWTAVGSAQSGLTLATAPSNQADTGLTTGAKYWFRYKVVDSAGSPATAYATAVSFTTVASTYTLVPAPSPDTVGMACIATVTPNGPFTGTVIVTPTGSASTGLSPITLTFSGTSAFQTASFTPTVTGTLTLTGTHTGTLTAGDPAAVNVTVNPAPFAAGTVTATPHKKSIGLSIGVPSGGTGPYSYLLEHAAVFGGTYATLASGSISGTVTYSHTGLVYRIAHIYRVTYTDSASGSAVAHLPSATLSARSEGLIPLGDSITQNILFSLSARATDTQFATNIRDNASSSADFAAMPCYNCGISGTSTKDWLSTRAAFTFSDLASNDTTAVPIDWALGKVAGLGAVDLVIFTITLGTNDAILTGGDDAPSAFKTRLTSIIAYIGTRMAALYPGQAYVVLPHYPPAAVPYPTNGNPVQRTEAQHGTLQAYQGQIDSLVDNVTVFQGDRDAFAFFAYRQDLIQSDNLHPSTTGGSASGSAALVKLQSDAITSFVVNEGYAPAPTGGSAAPALVRSSSSFIYVG